jgi:hypothetical protein
MLARRLIASVLVVAAVIMIWGCSDTKDCTCKPGHEAEPDSLLYSCSFEADADTAGWTVYGTVWLADDAPPEGGSRSFGVRGGCPRPHARYRLERLEVGGHYTVRFWARAVDSTGSVALEVAGTVFEGIAFSVEEPSWTLYSTEASVWCPVGQSLQVDINSGGVASSGGILVDLIEVIIAEP